MADVEYVVRGADKVVRALGHVREAAGDNEGLSEFGEQAADRSRGLVRIDTGRLQVTIRVEPTGTGVLVVAGDDSSPQAGVLDSGDPSRGIAGDQFLTGPANDPAGAADRVEARLASVIRSL